MNQPIDEMKNSVEAGKDLATQPTELQRKGLMLCCMITAERYGDSQRGDIPKGTTITCERCKQEIESTGGRAWKAK